MPRRKETALRRRIREQDIQTLREAVAHGVPWVSVAEYDTMKGRSNLIYLTRGMFYLAEYVRAPDDIETCMEIWTELREPILEQHVQREPFSRPWGFYALEDRPSRCRLSKEPCACAPLPEHDAKFPPVNLSWFGRPRFCRCDYETEGDYLSRLGLLLPGENAEQHGQI